MCVTDGGRGRGISQSALHSLSFASASGYCVLMMKSQRAVTLTHANSDDEDEDEAG